MEHTLRHSAWQREFRAYRDPPKHPYKERGLIIHPVSLIWKFSCGNFCSLKPCAVVSCMWNPPMPFDYYLIQNRLENMFLFTIISSISFQDPKYVLQPISFNNTTKETYFVGLLSTEHGSQEVIGLISWMKSRLKAKVKLTTILRLTLPTQETSYHDTH